jgi:diacylglycerol kinase (ATP)
MRIMIIGNPISGTGGASARIERFCDKLRIRGHNVEVFLTQKAGDAFVCAGRVDSNVDRLVIAGGDGTINEALNGLSDPSAVPILAMPTGSANMLARDLGLPDRLDALVSILEGGSIRRLDMGLLGQRRFLLVVSAGFDASVTEEISKRPRKTMGYRGYMWPAFRVAGKFQPMKIAVSVDESDPIVGMTVLVLKVRHYGGIFVVAEDAGLDSGCFHVCVLHRWTLFALLKYLVAAFTRRFSKLSDVTFLKGSRVKIESNERVPVEVDGDYFGTTPVEVELRPKVVPVIVP